MIKKKKNDSHELDHKSTLHGRAGVTNDLLEEQISPQNINKTGELLKSCLTIKNIL